MEIELGHSHFIPLSPYSISPSRSKDKEQERNEYGKE